MGILSTLGMISSTCIIFFIYYSFNTKTIKNLAEGDNWSEDARSYVLIFFTLFAIFTMLISAMGFFLCRCTNRWFVCSYSFLLLPTWILVSVIGLLAIFASTAGKD